MLSELYVHIYTLNYTYTVILCDFIKIIDGSM